MAKQLKKGDNIVITIHNNRTDKVSYIEESLIKSIRKYGTSDGGTDYKVKLENGMEFITTDWNWGLSKSIDKGTIIGFKGTKEEWEAMTQYREVVNKLREKMDDLFTKAFYAEEPVKSIFEFDKEVDKVLETLKK